MEEGFQGRATQKNDPSVFIKRIESNNLLLFFDKNNIQAWGVGRAGQGAERGGRVGKEGRDGSGGQEGE